MLLFKQRHAVIGPKELKEISTFWVKFENIFPEQTLYTQN